MYFSKGIYGIEKKRLESDFLGHDSLIRTFLETSLRGISLPEGSLQFNTLTQNLPSIIGLSNRFEPPAKALGQLISIPKGNDFFVIWKNPQILLNFNSPGGSQVQDDSLAGALSALSSGGFQLEKELDLTSYIPGCKVEFGEILCIKSDNSFGWAITKTGGNGVTGPNGGSGIKYWQTDLVNGTKELGSEKSQLPMLYPYQVEQCAKIGFRYTTKLGDTTCIGA